MLTLTLKNAFAERQFSLVVGDARDLDGSGLDTTALTLVDFVHGGINHGHVRVEAVTFGRLTGGAPDPLNAPLLDGGRKTGSQLSLVPRSIGEMGLEGEEESRESKVLTAQHLDDLHVEHDDGRGRVWGGVGHT